MKIPNRKNIELVPTKSLSRIEWLARRSQYIGASEMGSVLGINEYESALELFHRKVGVITTTKPETLSTYSGHIMEPVIYRHYWRYFDPENPTADRMIDNAENNRSMRTARRVNFTLVSKEYPWLSCSLDFAIDENKFSPPGPLDCKNSLQWVMNHYEGNISPHYVVQMQQQMFITGWLHSELFFLLDGRYPQVNVIPTESSIQATIVRESTKFWENVLTARKIWQRSDLSEHERLQAIVEFEPEITDSSALETYLKERYKSTVKKGQMQGTSEILEIAKKYLSCNEQINTIDKEKTLYGNLIRKVFQDSGVDEILFSDRVMISWRTVNDKPTLRVNQSLLNM